MMNIRLLEIRIASEMYSTKTGPNAMSLMLTRSILILG